MDKQPYLKLLWDELEVRYKKLEKEIAPVKWGQDAWVTLSVHIENFIKDSPSAIGALIENLEKKSKQKGQPRKIGTLSVSGSTIERIYKTVNRLAYTKEDYYDLSNPNRNKLTTLDVLSIFLDYENWNDFVSKKFNDEAAQRVMIGNYVKDMNNVMFEASKVESYFSLNDLLRYFIPGGSGYRRIEYRKYEIANKDNDFPTVIALDSYKLENITFNLLNKAKAIITVDENWHYRSTITDDGSNFHYITIRENTPEQKNSHKSIIDVELGFNKSHNFSKRYTVEEFLNNHVNVIYKYIYVLFNNGSEWKIEGKYLTNKTYEEILEMYRKVNFPRYLSDIPSAINGMGNNFYEFDWHRLIIGDYTIGF